jgi:hypothetical protein
MNLWCIENVDEAGEGMFIASAETKREALRMHLEKNPQAQITSIKRTRWVDLALVTGERGESYYYERKRGGPR